jgi:hypothetical protein
MTPEMAFECLLISHDPSVFCTVERILQDFSIHTNVCVTPNKVAALLAEGSTDLIVIDLESEDSSEVMHQIFESQARQKPTILGVSATDGAVPGIHVMLRKPVTPESGTRSLKVAYSRMLQDYRKHTRFALMTPVVARDDNNQTIAVTVTNIGEGGVGLTLDETLPIGTILFFRVPLPGLKCEINVQARVLWTREHGVAGCQFVRVPPGDLQVLYGWLESRYRFKKPLVET